MRAITATICVILLTACAQKAEQQSATNAKTENAADVSSLPPTENAPANATAADRAPLSEPNGPIDPKSAEAAGQVVQDYGALIEQDRWSEAENLWANAEAAAKFTAELRRYPEVHLEIGDLGRMEGAAGSIYITEPVVFYGKNAAGASFRRPAVVTLRRVNDVPGSTERQRRWHIERIEWTSGA